MIRDQLRVLLVGRIVVAGQECRERLSGSGQLAEPDGQRGFEVAADHRHQPARPGVADAVAEPARDLRRTCDPWLVGAGPDQDERGCG